MLVLSRKIGEVITVGTSVKITVLSYDRGVIRLGIEAPKSIPVHRKEVFDKIIEMNKQAARTELTALKKALNKSNVKFPQEDSDRVQPPSLLFSSSSKSNNQDKE
jgi:carbon storage regulator